MATTVTYTYTDGSQSSLTMVNYHSETTASLGSYFSSRIPRYAKITSGVVTARVKTSLSSKADLKMFFADSDTGNKTTFYTNNGSVGNSYVELTGTMTYYWNSEKSTVGTCSSSYSRVYVYMNATVLRRFYIDWIKYSLTYENPKLTVSVSANNSGWGTVSGGGTYEITKTAKTITVTAAPAVGYRFVKWQENGSTSASYSFTVADTDISGPTGTRSFTAVFEPIGYTISFDGNGATAGSMSVINAKYGTAVTLTNRFSKSYSVTFSTGGGSACAQQNAVSVFRGFSDENSFYFRGQVFSGAYFDAPYYANTYADLYQAFGYNKLTLLNHFLSNGIHEGRSPHGTERGVYPNGAAVTSLSTQHNDALTLKAQWTAGSVTLPSTSRQGYSFLGWYEDSGFSTPAGQPGDRYTPSGSKTLYAKWERDRRPIISSVSITPNPVLSNQGYIIAVEVDVET